MNEFEQKEFKSKLISSLKTARIYAYSLSRDKDLADDLTQQAMVKALENADRFDLSTNIQAWLNTIIKNLFYDHVKSHGVSKTETVAEMSDERTDSGNTQHNNIQISEISSYIDENLDEKSKSIFLMWVEGLKTDEIANAVDTTRSNVGVIVCRVRKQIYEKFAVQT